MDSLTQKVANTLLDWGADLVGIAPVERFKDAPVGHRPTDFLPECKSVISIGLHLFQGMADVWGEYDQPDKDHCSLSILRLWAYQPRRLSHGQPYGQADGI